MKKSIYLILKKQFLLIVLIVFVLVLHAQTKSITVGAKDAWVNTGIQVKNGSRLTFQYVSGKWTCDKNNHRYVDANGHTDEVESGLAAYSSYKTTQKAVFGCLLATVEGSNTLYIIGNNRTINFSHEGILHLRINDEGLGDNAGEITLNISKSSMGERPQPVARKHIKVE